MPAPRVTEQSNPLTRRLGTYSHVLSSRNELNTFEFGDGIEGGEPIDSLGVLRLLSSCDSQLFTGSDGLPSIYCKGPITAAAHCSQKIASVLQSGGSVIFAGCGTSGRLAHLLASIYNSFWKRNKNRPIGSIESPFDYCLAGGDAALLVPAESVEDSPSTGAADLSKILSERKISADSPHIVIGISCGLSAMYVAGVLRYSMTRSGAFTVAVGFNVLSAIASVTVPGSGPRFYDLLETLESNPSIGAVVNPVVGAEAVAGSSRMKGGSATLIILSSMIEIGSKLSQNKDLDFSTQSTTSTITLLRGCYAQAELAIRALYSVSSNGLAQILDNASTALCSTLSTSNNTTDQTQTIFKSKRYITPTRTGRILYIGTGAAGLLGLIDASEATDTYGSAFNDVRGFTSSGWEKMSVRSNMIDPVIPLELRGIDIDATNVHQTEYANPSLASFIDDFVPTLTPLDCVVALWVDSFNSDPKDKDTLLNAVSAALCTSASIHAIIVQKAATTTCPFSNSIRTLDSRIHLVEIELPTLDMTSTNLLSSSNVVSENIKNNNEDEHSVPVLGLLALKLSLNALTTGAHVSKGVIVGNIMGNMMLTNHKLYLRAIGIVTSLVRCTILESRRAILRAIYELDDTKEIDALILTEEQDDSTVHKHVAKASTTPRVIPTALLLAAPTKQGGRAPSVLEVINILSNETRVQRAYNNLQSLLI